MRAVNVRGRARLGRAVQVIVEGLERRQLLAGEPHVLSAQFLDESIPHKVRVTFDQDVSASLTKSDFFVRKEGSDSTRLSPNVFTLSYDTTTNAATLTYTGNGGELADGYYNATIYAEDVLNTSGQPLASLSSFDFTTMYGDVNHDGKSDSVDQAVIAATLQANSYNPASGGLSQGDANYDGIVSIDDFDSIGFTALPTLRGYGDRLTVYRTSSTTLELQWDDAPNETGYKLQSSTDGKFWSQFDYGVATNQTNYTFDNGDPFTDPIFFRVRAVLPTGETSKYSSARSEYNSNQVTDADRDRRVADQQPHRCVRNRVRGNNLPSVKIHTSGRVDIGSGDH